MSNISIIFDCSMLILCHCYMFLVWFHNILWTNLLTRCPVPISVCFVCDLQKRPKNESAQKNLKKLQKIRNKQKLSEPEGQPKGSPRAPSMRGPRLGVVPAPRGSPGDALWTIYSPRQKNLTSEAFSQIRYRAPPP